MEEHELYFNYERTLIDNEYNRYEIKMTKKKIELEPQLRELLIKSDEEPKAKATISLNKHILKAYRTYTKAMGVNADVVLINFMKDYVLNSERAKGYLV